MKTFLSSSSALLSIALSLLLAGSLYGQAMTWIESPNSHEVSICASENSPAIIKVKSNFLSLGLNLYSREEWISAGEVLSRCLRNNNLNSIEKAKALFHLASCNLKTEEHHLAAMNFHDLLELSFLDENMRQEAEYLQALTWCQLSENEGRTLMRKIAQNHGHIYYNSASSILKEFD